MTTTPSAMTTSGQIESELNYIKPDSTLAPEVFYSGGAAPQEYIDAYAFMPATIDDARSSQETFSVHKHGFQLVTAPTTHKDFTDQKMIEASYYDVVIAIIKEATSVKDVFVFDHTVRRGSADSSRKPAHHVHNDYTEQTAQSRAEERIGVEQFAKLKDRRMIQINVWRPLVETVKRSPLAFCNAASINQEDLLVSRIHFPDTDHVGEIYALRKAAGQQWVYFSEMSHDEAVLIKGFDSVKEDGIARFTPHTAFEYPDQDPNIDARASIEVRTFAFY